MRTLFTFSLLYLGVILNAFSQSSCTPLSGNYTIDKTAVASATNFTSFGAAATALVNCGVGGAVTFSVVANTGPYNEQVILPAITGTSATNTVTFEGNGNTVSGAGTTANKGVFTFNGADYVKLNNLKIGVDAAATIGSGVYFINASDNDIISNCTINLSLASQGMDVNGILAGSSGGNNANNLLIQNNIINGGFYGILLTGSTATTGNKIIGNQVRDQRSYGIYIYNGGTGTIIEGNDLSRPTRVNGSGLYGITLDGTTSNTIVSKNRIHNTHDVTSNLLSFVYAIYTTSATTTGNENIIKNNLIYNINNNGGTFYAFYNSGASGTYYYHNTVSADNPAISNLTLRGAYFASAVNNVKFINNIISIPGPATNKHAIYLNTTNIFLVSNNNDLYVGGTGNIGYSSGNLATLANWQTGGFDLSSVSVNPLFINPATGLLQPGASQLNNAGQPVAAVTDDITGAPRNSTTPDIGAYEFAPAANDAGVTAIISPTSPVSPGSQAVLVTLKNFGSANLTSATFGWSVNGAPQANYNWTGSLTSLQTTATPVNIGSYIFPAGNFTLKVWANTPNGLADAIAANDTATLKIVSCAPLAGNYTINKNNPTAGTNFQSISDAVQRLTSCGVSAPVTLTVASGTGPYNEQVEIRNIPFASATNTITFEGSGNTVSVTPGLKPGIFVLNGAKYVKLNNFVITLPATATSGWGIQLLNAADFNTISNNTVNLPIASTLTNGIVAGTSIETKGNNTNNTKIQNNIINGGGCGIQINGNDGGLNADNNQIIGNQVKDCHYYGIYVGNAAGTLIEGNEISRPTRTTTSTFNGIYLFSAVLNSTISKNRIHNTHDMVTATGTSVNGIYYNPASATNVGNNVFRNNLIYNLNCPAGNAIGIYNSGGPGNAFYHNTITSDPTFTYTSLRGFYLTGAATNIKFINNIVSLPGATGNKYAIYLTGTGITLNSNNNDLYIGNAGNIGFYIGDQPTLAFWKTVNSNAYDQNSVSVDPLFVNAATGNLQPSSVGVNNIGQALPGVTDDITGTSRNTTTPDPGAYEFGTVANDVGIVAVSGPTTKGCGLTATENITVTIKNFGSATQTSIPVTYSINGTAIPAAETFTGSIIPNATATYTFTTKANLAATGTYQIIARTQLTGDAFAGNDPDTLSVTNTLISGTPAPFDFETAATGLSKFRKVINSKSNIVEGTGASFGATSTKGMIMDGIDNAAWVTPAGVTDPWTNNPENFAGAYICISPVNYATPDSLWMTFDLKQLFKTANVNTNFRVTLNGTQVGPTYRPAFSGVVNWQKIKVDLTGYKNSAFLQIGLESSVKEAYANGTGTANLIDNIQIKRRLINGVKGDVLQAQIHVFPNPSNGQFSIDLPEGKTYQLEVTDLSGKTILKQAAESNAQLNLEGTAKGIYLLKVTSEGNIAFRKLIVE